MLQGFELLLCSGYLSLMTFDNQDVEVFLPQIKLHTVEPRFNEVAGDRSNLFVKWRVCYIKNLDIMNLRGHDQNVRYIEVIVND